MKRNWYGRLERRYGPVYASGNGPHAVIFRCYAATGLGEPFVFLSEDAEEAERYLARENAHGCKVCGLAKEGREFGYHDRVDLRTHAEQLDDELLELLEISGRLETRPPVHFAGIGWSAAAFRRGIQRLLKREQIVLDEEANCYRPAEAVKSLQ
jgi:hypothetical protein